MFKKLSGYVAAILFLPLLAILLIPAFYALAWMLVLILPPVCAMAIFQDARENNSLGNHKDLLSNLFLAIVVVPVAILAFAAPLRAILLAALSFFPMAMGVFAEIHAFVYAPLIPIFGELFPYQLDLYWGILSVVTIFLIALCDSIRRNRLTRQIEVLPTAKIRSVAIGLAELKGKAVPLDGRSVKVPIMRSWIESTQDGVTTREHAEPFYLEDSTGRILVDPRGASINVESDFFGVSLHQAILKQFKQKRGLPESRLMPGDTVYLTGNVQINRGRADAGDDEVVVKPRKSSWLSLSFFDLFFLSNISEEALLAGFRKSIKRGWRTVFIGMAFGAWLSVFALTNIIQIEASRVEAAPRHYRFVSAPTTLERRISVSKLGEHPTIHFLDMLEEGDVKKTKVIMRKFRELNLERLALPILEAQATDIDHRGFASANYWLSRLGEMPHGYWGYEPFSEHYVSEYEAVVLRLLTRYEDNRLHVSYRAHIGAKRMKEGDRIRSRKIVIQLTNGETGRKHRAAFDAAVGFNNADDVEAFEFLYPGTYELLVYPETYYRSGFYNRGSRSPSGVEIRLKN